MRPFLRGQPNVRLYARLTNTPHGKTGAVGLIPSHCFRLDAICKLTPLQHLTGNPPFLMQVRLGNFHIQNYSACVVHQHVV